MICELEGVNNRDDVEDLVVFSTDIEAMYPSLDTDHVAADLAREFLDWTSILTTERQDVCEGTITIEIIIIEICLCLCFYFDSKVSLLCTL